MTDQIAKPMPPHNPDWEVTPDQVRQWLKQGEDIFILDVRRPEEWDIARLEKAVLIPLQQLTERVHELNDHRHKRLVIHCHHGVRSLRATALLRELGFKHVHSMAGGIDAWSLTVDPAVPRYR